MMIEDHPLQWEMDAKALECWCRVDDRIGDKWLGNGSQ